MANPITPSLRLIKYPNTAAQIIKAYDAGVPLAPAFFDKPEFYQAIYFEDMLDRTLEECVADYQKEEAKLLNTVMPQAIISASQVLTQFTLKLQPRR